ncbi:putative ankyrin repeat protein [Tupanvirus deep ocean]|uniref:Ankyrin repeat protein n=1 Tax=Tupanvirus soda lake TaxID=2126985 RepID=A0A2K9L2E6_9VIRU|nr:putative ankyrin repeat protein [Tupanvirus deep ocean]AUL79942.2 putative ankyrin repeat protein [Tupanvirus deep ocean]
MERERQHMPLFFNMWNNTFRNNGFDNFCPLTSAIRELSAQPDVDDFHKLRKIVQTASPRVLGELLRSACRKGVLRDVELMVPMVVANGQTADINESFCLACQNNHIAVMKLLLHNGAKVSYYDNLPIRRAVSGGHVEAVEFLLNNGADVHADDDKLLMICCQSGDYVDVLKLLINRDIDVLKNYHAAYNCCLNLGRNECGCELVRYSNTKPVYKSSTPIKECSDEIEKLIETEEYNNLNEVSSDTDECCSNDTYTRSDENSDENSDEESEETDHSGDYSVESNESTSNDKTTNPCPNESTSNDETTNPHNNDECRSESQSQTTETNNTTEPERSN